MKKQVKTEPTTNGETMPMDARNELLFNQLLADMRADNYMLMPRLAHMLQSIDPRRDINAECGYPDMIDAHTYRKVWNRDGIAQRVVEVLPKESWQKQPQVYEDEDTDEQTDFELAWDMLGESLRGGDNSFFREEAGSLVWEYLLRADIMSGIGSYGVILLGIDDRKPLDQPVAGVVKYPEGPQRTKGGQQYFTYNEQSQRIAYKEKVEPGQKPPETVDDDDIKALEQEAKTVETKRKLLFMRVFDESTATVTRWENNPASPRYKMPVMYLLDLNDPEGDKPADSGGQSTVQVHWSRIIHIADNLGSSEIAGEPRMKPVFDRLYDLRKVYGGGGEGYWRGAYNGLSFETHPQLGANAKVDTALMKDKIEQLRNGLQRDIFTSGMTAKSIAPNVQDPTAWIKVFLEALCIKIGVPMRVFLGSERGELASSQDDSTWNDRLMSRQQMYVTPRIIVPFVDRLILIGVLPVPKMGYCVRWEDLNKIGPSMKADFGLKMTQALAAYVAGNVEAIMSLPDYLTRVWGFTDEEAESVLENAKGEGDDGADRLTPDPEVQREEDAEMAAEQFGQQTELQKAALAAKTKAGAFK